MSSSMSRSGRSRSLALASRLSLLALLAVPAVALLPASVLRPLDRQRPLVIGSKAFTESVVLGELARQALIRDGVPAKHLQNLGGTRIVWEALRSGIIDLYPDYTGTIIREVLTDPKIQTEADLRGALAALGLGMTGSLGFNNTYEIAMTEARADRLGIQSIDDLAAHPELKFGFSSEFIGRSDGWPGLQAAYKLPQKDVRGLEHTLAYEGLASGSLDVIEIYGTDPQARGLRLLKDRRRFFPPYYAVYVYRKELEQERPEAIRALTGLAGRVSTEAITEMNTQAQPKSGAREVTEAQIAAEFLDGMWNPYFRSPEAPYFSQPVKGEVAPSHGQGSLDVLSEIGWATLEHLGLVVVSLLAALVVALPLGVLAARRPRLGQAILGSVGIIQTIPSLALLVFLIPLLGIGVGPAVVALFLYSLLPIVRNTYAGLTDLSIQVRESAEALGLPPWARLWLIDLPMASRSILAGIKTSAVINVGTATLGGIVAAGGYGQLIMNGIRLNNKAMILEGAIPAALLALAVQGLFELAERYLVPRGLQLASAA